MIADRNANVVCVADTLEPKFPDVYRELKLILTEHGIPLRTIPGTLDIWCRDYMPVQVSEDRFVQFRYTPDYLTAKKYRHLMADGEIGPKLPWLKNSIRSEIVLDGGNVIRWRDKVILTEKIFAENPNSAREQLMCELEGLFGVDRLILIPPERGDVTGHADGVVRFVNGDSVVVNDYRRIDPEYRHRLLPILEAAGLEVHEVPYQPGSGSSQGMPSAVGNYVNFLQVGTVLIMPFYGLPEDGEAKEKLSRYFSNCLVTALDCRELAKSGGVLNCVSWTFATTG
jgi:agmatine deiminase